MADEKANFGCSLCVRRGDLYDPPDRLDPIQVGNIWFESHCQYSFANVGVYRFKDFIRIDRSTEKSSANEKGSNRKGKAVIAVADFDNNGLEYHELSLIMDLFAESLLSTVSFRVLERKELLNASLLATGSCGRLGDEYVISLKLLNIESGESVAVLNRALTIRRRSLAISTCWPGS